MSRIPKDEKGKLLYEETDADTAWDAVVEQAGGNEEMAQKVVGRMVAKKEKALKKVEKAEPKTKDDADIAEMLAAEEAHEAAVAKAQAELDFWKNVAATTERRTQAEEESADQAQDGIENASDIDENGHPFITSSNGTTVFGEITEDSGLTAAPIKLSEGFNKTDENGNNIGYGLLHIEAGHGKQILEAGYSSVQEFVEDVCRNYKEIRIGKNRKSGQTYMLLELHDEKHKRTLYVELAHDGTYWNVNSGGIFRDKYTDKNDIVWPEPTVGSNAITDTAEVTDSPTEVANGETVDRGGNSSQPISSENKGNGKSENLQQNPEKSLADVPEMSADRSTDARRVEEEQPRTEEQPATETEQKATEEAKHTEAEQPTEEAEPKPIGKGAFGNIYDQFKGKVKEAFDSLMRKKSGDLLGVFHRDGVGDIDLVWGNEDMGVAHILLKHVGEGKDFATSEEAISMIEKIIDGGNIIRDNENRYVIELNGYRVGIRKNFDGEKKNWVVTAIDYNRSKEEKGIATNPTSASHGVEGSEFAAPNNTSSEGKVTTKSAARQTKSKKKTEPQKKPGEKVKVDLNTIFSKPSGLRIGGRGKRAINISQFTLREKSQVNPLTGVRYEDGVVVASDGHILVAFTTDYDEKYEGKTVEKSGEITDKGYRNWKSILPTSGERVDVDDFLRTVDEATAATFIAVPSSHGNVFINYDLAKKLAIVVRKANNAELLLGTLKSGLSPLMVVGYANMYSHRRGA